MRLDRVTGRLWNATGQLFDPAAGGWRADAAPPAGDPVTPVEAVTWLQRESGAPCRAPVAVIGPRDPTAAQEGIAGRLGERLARMGMVVLCGGLGGVMEAACRGVAAQGGVSVGLLPQDHWQAANRHVTIALATGIGPARNAIIARAAFCLIAVGGGHGTLSEIALGLQFGRPVFTLAGAPAVEGAVALGDEAEAPDAVARVLLDLG